VLFRSNVGVEAYRYFVASMVWRFDVAGRLAAGRPSAGDAAGLARYLLGKVGPPPHALFYAYVGREDEPFQVASGVAPVGSCPGIFGFHVPGVEFRLHLDRRRFLAAPSSLLPSEVDFVFALRDSWESPSTGQIADLVRRSPRKGRLAR
jgi:hypothetical protein